MLEKCPQYQKVEFLSLNDSTQADLVEMVKKHCDFPGHVHTHNRRLRYIPIVDSIVEMNLLYQIKVSDLKTYCEIYFGDLMDFTDQTQTTTESIHVLVKPDDLALGVERV